MISPCSRIQAVAVQCNAVRRALRSENDKQRVRSTTAAYRIREYPPQSVHTREGINVGGNVKSAESILLIVHIGDFADRFYVTIATVITKYSMRCELLHSCA